MNSEWEKWKVFPMNINQPVLVHVGSISEIVQISWGRSGIDSETQRSREKRGWLTRLLGIPEEQKEKLLILAIVF